MPEKLSVVFFTETLKRHKIQIVVIDKSNEEGHDVHAPVCAIRLQILSSDCTTRSRESDAGKKILIYSVMKTPDKNKTDH